MQKRQRTGWRRLWAATGYSIRGLRSAWINETAFRQELLLVLLLTPLAFWLGTTQTQRALLILSLLLILITELLYRSRCGPHRQRVQRIVRPRQEPGIGGRDDRVDCRRLRMGADGMGKMANLRADSMHIHPGKIASPG